MIEGSRVISLAEVENKLIGIKSFNVDTAPLFINLILAAFTPHEMPSAQHDEMAGKNKNRRAQERDCDNGKNNHCVKDRVTDAGSAT